MNRYLLSPAKTLQRVCLPLAAVLAIAMVPLRVCAQDKTCTHGSTVFVNVENRNGGPVSGLTAANFHGSVGKEALPITSAKPAQIRRIVIVLDQSGSMYVADADVSAASLIANIVAHSPIEYQFALLTYAKSIRVRKAFTSNHAELMDALREAAAVKAPNGP